jgi:hypothetical protein
MDVKISLSDIDDVASVELANCDDNGYIWITLQDKGSELSAKVSVEQLKLALRKLTTK